MKHVSLLIGGAALVGLGAAFWFEWGPFEDKPTYYHSDGIRIYRCYQSEDVFQVEFREQGVVAVVTHAGQTATLRYVGGEDWIKEVYSNGAVTLVLDPEARLEGLVQKRIGPCQ